MSLEKELETLQRQRRAEIRNLHSTYLRTKREIQRAASPTRIVRRHIGVSLAAAAALGMLLAPRPGPRAPAGAAESGGKKRGGVSLKWARKMLGKISPQLADYLPDVVGGHGERGSKKERTAEPPQPAQPEPQERGGEAKKGTLRRLIESVLPLLLSKINWRQLVERAMEGFAQRMHQHTNGHSADAPHMSVADAGTIHPHDYEHFE